MTTSTLVPDVPVAAEELIGQTPLRQRVAELTPVHTRFSALPTPQEWTTLSGIANVLSESEVVPKDFRGRPRNIMAVFLKGRDLGLSPTESLWGIYMIEGVPTLAAHTMTAMIRRAHHRLWYRETSRESATLVAERYEGVDPDTRRPFYGPEESLTWSIDDAITAQLVKRATDGSLVALSSNNKPLPWMLYPAALLRARAATGLARMSYSDVLMGAWYSPEELGAEVDAGGKVIRLPGPDEAVTAFERTVESARRQIAEQTAGEPESARPPQASLRDGQAMAGQLGPNVIDVKAESTPPPAPPSREELFIEIAEQARVLAEGSMARFTTRAALAYKANVDDWTDDQLWEFVQSRREPYQREIAARPELAPKMEPPTDGAVSDLAVSGNDAGVDAGDAVSGNDEANVQVSDAEPVPEGDADAEAAAELDAEHTAETADPDAKDGDTLL